MDMKTAADRVWTAYFRQREAGILLTVPAVQTCHQIFSTMPEADREKLRGFFLSDEQIPQNYADSHGLSVKDLMPVIEEAESKLLRLLFGFDLMT